MNGFLDDLPEVELPEAATRLGEGRSRGQGLDSSPTFGLQVGDKDFINAKVGGQKKVHQPKTVRPKAKQSVINTGDKVRTIIWYVIKCPKCKSTKVPVTKTCRPIRYHKCSDCGYNFKSVEQ